MRCRGSATSGPRSVGSSKDSSTVNLSAIFATMDARAAEVVPGPPSIGAQAREAVEGGQANQAVLARRYIGWLAGEIRDRTLRLEGSDANRLAEALIASISG